MQPSNSFYNLITLLEGLKTKAYQDSVGIWTIGIGTIQYPDGKKVKKGDVCTDSQAYEYLKYEVDKKVGTINGLLNGVTLNQNQFDALVSFSFNLGLGTLKQSTLLKKLNTGDTDGAAAEILKFHFAGPKSIPGLVARRQAEHDLFIEA